MQIEKLTKPHRTAIKDINTLIDLCNSRDGIRLTFDPDDDLKEEDDINTFLLYDKDRLVSAVLLFAPTRKEAEITAFTRPEYRRQGCFTRLMKEVRKDLRRRGTPELLFVCDSRSRDGLSTVSHIKAVYDFSEFLMRFDPAGLPPLTVDSGLTLKPCAEEDSPELLAIGMDAFDQSREDAEDFNRGMYTSDRREFHTICLDDRIIGMIGVYREETGLLVHGFALRKEFRGRGFGKQALYSLLTKYSGENRDRDILLEVNAENPGALSLYTKMGFRTLREYRYSRLPAAPL